jgi:hypothetical protein
VRRPVPPPQIPGNLSPRYGRSLAADKLGSMITLSSRSMGSPVLDYALGRVSECLFGHG